MRLLLSVLIIGLILSCQEKKSSDEKDQSEEKTVQKSSIQRVIEDTYNFKAYQKKKNVALNLLLINEDSVDLQIYLQPKNDLQIVQKDENFLYLTDNQTYEMPVGSFEKQEINRYKHLALAYQIPYQLSDYQIEKTSDSLQIDDKTSLKRSFQLTGNNNIRLFLSAKTDLIKSIEFSGLSESTYLVYDKYITVQQIPISMRRSIYQRDVLDQKAKSKVKVQKINYPDELPFDFKLPEQAKPIQNK